MIKAFILFTLLFSRSIFARDVSKDFSKTYFVLGDQSTPAKAELTLTRSLSKHEKLFFIYHHKAIWDINHRSSPVVDSNYNPSLFYKVRNQLGWDIHLGIIEHLSNGRTGNDSRGVNMSFVEGFNEVILFGKNLSLRFKTFISYKKDNGSPDIQEYMGIWNFSLRLNNFISPIEQEHFLTFDLNPGGEWGTDIDKGSFTSSFAWKPQQSLNLFLYYQYFRGRNEYLLNYRNKTESNRLGVRLNF